MNQSALVRFRMLNVRYASAHWKRSLSCVTAVMVACALIVAIAGIYRSLTQTVAVTAENLYGTAAYEVTGAADTGLPIWLVGKIASVPGVAAAEPVIKTIVNSPRQGTLLLGVTPDLKALHSRVSNDILQQADRDASPRAHAGGAIAGPALHIDAGQLIDVDATPVHVDFVPKGRLAEEYAGGAYLILPLDQAQHMLHKVGQVNSVFVVAKPGVDLRSLGADLIRVTDHRAVIADPHFRVTQTDTSLSLTRDVLLLVGSIALVVAMFIVFNTMNMAVVQRRPTMATLRALGARRRQLATDLLVEVSVIGVVGGCLGAPVGVGLSYLAIKRLPPLLMQSVDVKPEFFVPGGAIAAVIALGILACVLGAAVPAVAVFKTSAASAMRPADIEDIGTTRSHLTWFAAVVGVSLTVAAFVIAQRLHGEGALLGASLAVVGALMTCWALGSTLVRASCLLAIQAGPAGQVSKTTMSQATKRTWANIMIVVIAVALGSVTNGVLSNVTNSTGRFFASLAESEVYLSAASKDVIPVSPLLPDGIVQRVRQIRGVDFVVPVQYAYVNVGSDRVLVVGADHRTVTPAFSSMEPAVRAEVEAGHGVVISRALGRNLSLSRGDLFELNTPTGEKRLRVLGVVDYLTTESGMLALSLENMQKWFARDGATYLEVHVAKGQDATEVLREVQQIATAHQLYAFSGQEAVDAGRSAIAQIGSLALFVQWIVAILAAVALFNAFMISVIERRREIGVLRAMGASRRYVRKSILTEASSTAIVGGALGLTLGLVVQHLGVMVMSTVTAITVKFEYSAIALVNVVVAVILCWTGVLLPARRASQANIVDALEVE